VENGERMREDGRVAGLCVSRGLINFPKAFLLRFLASKNEEEYADSNAEVLEAWPHQ